MVIWIVGGTVMAYWATGNRQERPHREFTTARSLNRWRHSVMGWTGASLWTAVPAIVI